MKIVEHLIRSIRGAAQYNPGAQVAPVCILWPDRELQWETVIPRMQKQIAELFVLGDYDPAKKRGPAIWLRCVIEGKVQSVELPEGATPVIYLPGISRQDLRVVESLPDTLKPLAELQYRGTLWSQLNAKDWTVLAMLKSIQGGLGLDVTQDQETKSAMLYALEPLLDQEVEPLRGRQLDKTYFNELIIGGDNVRELLLWLDQGDAYKDKLSKSTWRGFVEGTKANFEFNPEKEGLLAGAARIADHHGSWQTVWERYCEAPLRYPNIPDLIRKCAKPKDDILWIIGEGFEGWPQWNDEKEEELRNALLEVADLPLHEVRAGLKELEQKHARRRSLIWAELGETPLAYVLEQLVRLAELTEKSLAGGTIDHLVNGYQEYGWLADQAVIKALGYVLKPDHDVVATIIRNIYKPWADAAAKHLQNIVHKEGYPGGDINCAASPEDHVDSCYLFVDGLRYDTAVRLRERLIEKGFNVTSKTSWSALPSVTATAKPAVSPVRTLITGREINTDFEPSVAENGQSLRGGQVLKRLLDLEGWSVLEDNETGSTEGKAWCETGNLDYIGHKLGCKLVAQLERILHEIAERIGELVQAGWPEVRVVTDHGWLLMPGGLPKQELPVSLTENKWGRCAVVKEGARTDETLYPWYWNPDVHFALAVGIRCYRSGLEYAHGGLSLQECLMLELKVTPGDEVRRQKVAITGIRWAGLRCRVTVEGSYEGLNLDIRLQPGLAESSVVHAIKSFSEDCTASVAVEDDSLISRHAVIVLFEADGEPVAQLDTVIGGED